MSDTPQTDAAISDAWVLCGVHVVSADFARQLERELEACKTHERVANILSTVSDTPETDAFLTAENCTRGNPVAFDWLVGFARSLERKAANAYKGYQACNDDLIKCDAEVMRWFKAASPYATPGSLEEGLKRLEHELKRAHGEIDALRAAVDSWRRLDQNDAPIDSSVKPSAWD